MYCFLNGGNDSCGHTSCVVSSSANLSCKCLQFSLFRSAMILLLKLSLHISYSFIFFGAVIMKTSFTSKNEGSSTVVERKSCF